MHGSKTCFKCFKELPVSAFYAHPAMGDGHLGKCKECTKADVTANRLKNVERIRAYDRERAKHSDRMRSAAIQLKKWRSEDKRRMQCHNAVAREMKKGTILRQPCCVCSDPNSSAHHESYDRPLDVAFYCQIHHSARHKEMAILGIVP